MQFQSLRRFRVGAVLANVAILQFRFPDGRDHTFKTIVLGAANFGRIGQYESLGWPPITCFTKFDWKVLKVEGSLGYAKRLALSGNLMKTHLIHGESERIQIKRLESQLVGTEIQNFRRWLKSVPHEQTRQWTHQIQRLEQTIKAYGSHQLKLMQVIQRFKAVYATDKWHRQKQAEHFEKLAWDFSSQFERELDQFLPIAYLLVNIKNIELYQYSNQRDILLHPEANQPSLAYTSTYIQHMFYQLKAQKVQAQQLGLPFYDPDWLANKQRFQQPVWDPAQLDAFNIEDNS